jgi:regulator of nonsense transcripts 2
MRKKQAMSLDGRYTIMIENAFYYCNPPENKQIEKKVLNPLHEYVKKLLYKDLNKLCVEKVLRQMRKLNWNDEPTRQYAVKSLIAIWNVKYNTVHCMANLVSGLALYHVINNSNTLVLIKFSCMISLKNNRMMLEFK